MELRIDSESLPLSSPFRIINRVFHGVDTLNFSDGHRSGVSRIEKQSVW